MKAAGCALALAGCGPTVRESDRGFMPAAPSQESRLSVRNDYFGELDIYVLTGSTRSRIGSVPAGGAANFHIPRYLLVRPEIHFQVDPVGPVGPFTFQPILIAPGNVVELAVAQTLQMSSHSRILH